MFKHHQITLLNLYISLPFITGFSPNPVFSGFQPDCQTCLDGAVQLCSSANKFDDFCICTTSGAGYDKTFNTCPNICGRDDRNRGRVLLTQWADYCCALMPEDSVCAGYLKDPESVIPSALPTSSAVTPSVTTTPAAAATTNATPTSSKSTAQQSFGDPAVALVSAIGLVSLLMLL